MTEHNEEHSPKGSYVLVFIFLAMFALYYFLNFKMLAGVWPVR